MTVPRSQVGDPERGTVCMWVGGPGWGKEQKEGAQYAGGARSKRKHSELIEQNGTLPVVAEQLYVAQSQKPTEGPISL